MLTRNEKDTDTFVSLCFCVTLLHRKIKVACVGNSITYGYTLPDRETNAYPAKLQKMLGMIMWLVTLESPVLLC